MQILNNQFIIQQESIWENSSGPIDNNSSKVYNISNILNAMRELSEDDWLREKTVGESLSMKLGG